MLKFIILVYLFICQGCFKESLPIVKEINKTLAVAESSLKINEVKTQKIENSYEGDYILITQPYIGDAILKQIIKDKTLLDKIVFETGAQETMHLYIIGNNKVLVHEILPNYVDIPKGILYSSNKKIRLIIKKIERKNRPLLIEAIE